MKSVLLTNFKVTEYSGSEIDTVTIANCLLKMGYSVDIFTLNYGLPLTEKLNKKVRVLSYRESDKLKKHYDLMWAHHFPLLDYLIFNKEIKIDYIHYISLSSFEPYECPPFYYDELNKVSVLSAATIKCLAEEEYKTKNFEVFSNGATQNFFDKAKESCSDELSKICIVSNHVPKELYEFKQIANNNKILVDIFGKGDTFADITPELLVNYDLIISIGKTINYGLALKVPCYCYDHFGGDLYITKENVKKSHEHNFSGRRLKIKKTAQELYDDIIANYKNALKDVTDCQKYAYDNFCTENQIKKVITELKNTSKFDTTKICKKYPTMKRRSELFIREVTQKLEYQNLLANDGLKLHVYYYNRETGQEEVKNFLCNNKLNKVNVEFPVKINTDVIRIDFDTKDSILLKSVYLDGKKQNDIIFFNMYPYLLGHVSIVDNPYINIECSILKDEILKLEINFEVLDKKTIIDELYRKINDNDKKINLQKKALEIEKVKSINSNNLLLEKSIEIQRLKQNNEDKQSEIMKIINSKSWKATKPLRYISKKFKIDK